jgi:hypothetical protein
MRKNFALAAVAFTLALTGIAPAQVAGLTAEEDRQLQEAQGWINDFLLPKMGLDGYKMPEITHIPGPCGRNARQYWHSEYGFMPCPNHQPAQHMTTEQIIQIYESMSEKHSQTETEFDADKIAKLLASERAANEQEDEGSILDESQRDDAIVSERVPKDVSIFPPPLQGELPADTARREFYEGLPFRMDKTREAD